MVKRIKFTEAWVRKKLGSKARSAEDAQSYLKDFDKLSDTFAKREDFIDYVKRKGNHSYGYLYVVAEISIDEAYDPHNSGMVSIEISKPQYYAMIYRPGIGWGENRYGEHNFLPPFDWQACVPSGYPCRIVKYGHDIVEEVDPSVPAAAAAAAATSSPP